MVKARVLEAIYQRSDGRGCRCSECLAGALGSNPKAINKNLYDYARQGLILRGLLPDLRHGSRLQAVLTQHGLKRLKYFRSKGLTIIK